MDKYKKLKSVLGSELKEHIVLRDYASMRVGGVADYFYVAKKIDNLIEAVFIAKKLDIPFIVLGGATNVLISDYGFGGLVILNRTSNLAILQDKSQIIADSGVSLMRLIVEAANNNLGGMEPLYGIPGTIGGAIYGNAGAFGVEICQFIKSITVLTDEGKIMKYNPAWLEANYRITKLKKNKDKQGGQTVILSIRFQFSHNKKEDILKKLSYYKQNREQKQPYTMPSIGSIFKNPGKNPEQSAGYILDQLGAKKIKIEDAQVSKEHANFIINKGKANATQIKQLVNLLKDLVREKENIELKEEFEYIGQWDNE